MIYHLPQFIANGSVSGVTTGLTPGLPAYQVGDILLCWAESANETVTLTTANGWALLAEIGTGTAAAVDATRLTVFWIYANTTVVAPVIADPGDHLVAYVQSYRYGRPSTAPDVLATGVLTPTSTAVALLGGTTSQDNSLVISAVSNAVDSATAQFTAGANAAGMSFTVRGNANNVAGNGGGINVSSSDKATAGAFGTTAGTLTTTSLQALITLAIRGGDADVAAYVAGLNADPSYGAVGPRIARGGGFAEPRDVVTITEEGAGGDRPGRGSFGGEI